jgi:hypothetical protein
MSLNWTAEDVPEFARTQQLKDPDGKEGKPEMHPVMHSLIWLTLILGCDFRKPEEVKKRFALIHRLDPNLLILKFGLEAGDYKVYFDGGWMSFNEYYVQLGFPVIQQGSRHIEVHLNPDAVCKLYCNLKTNGDIKTYAQWSKRYIENALRDKDRSYATHIKDLLDVTALPRQPLTSNA